MGSKSDSVEEGQKPLLSQHTAQDVGRPRDISILKVTSTNNDDGDGL